MALSSESLSTAYWGHRAWVWCLLLVGGWLCGAGLAELMFSISENGWSSASSRWTWQRIGAGLAIFGLAMYRDTRRLPAGTTLADVRAAQRHTRRGRPRRRISQLRHQTPDELEPAVAQGPDRPRLRVAAWLLLFLAPVLMHLAGEALFGRTPGQQPSPLSIFVLVAAALAIAAVGLNLDVKSRGGESLRARLSNRLQL